jgi:hypothetical protein
MSIRSFSDLPSQQRRERIAAVLAMGLAIVLAQRSQSRPTLTTQALSFSLESGSPYRKQDYVDIGCFEIVVCDNKAYFP